jgi:aldehyde:ferredoxin oxidoreductase
MIENHKISILEAQYLWGMDTQQTIKAIRQQADDPRLEVMAIGPAGENLVKFASVMSYDGHAGGRTGMGCVMGSKNLKAVAANGSGMINLAQPEEFKKLFRELVGRISSDQLSGEVAPSLGTTVLINFVNETGALGTRNFQSGYFENAEDISGETLLEKYTPWGRGRACGLCPIACDRSTRVDKGEFAGTWAGSGPEYATLQNQGARLGNKNLAAIIKANDLCNRYGLDTYSTGGVIGFAYELYEKGIMTSKDTDGLELTWGNYHSQLELIRKIALREGIGDLLAEGVRRVCQQVGQGSHHYAIEIKGMEYPSKDARGDKMYGLCVTTAARGADHLYSLSEFPANVEMDTIRKMFGTEKAADPHLPDGKGKVVSFFEEACTLTDLLGICKLVYVTYVASMKELMYRRQVLSDLLRVVTGRELSYQELLETAHRVTTLERCFNIREAGTGRSDDVPPPRFTDEPMPAGPAKGNLFETDPMLDEFYDTIGFERTTGWPYQETLKGLGLNEVKSELLKRGIQLPSRRNNK